MNKGDQELGRLLGELYTTVNDLIATWPSYALAMWTDEQVAVHEVFVQLERLRSGETETTVYTH